MFSVSEENVSVVEETRLEGGAGVEALELALSVKVGSGDEWDEPDEWKILFSISDNNVCIVSVVEKTRLEVVAGVEALELEGDARE